MVLEMPRLPGKEAVFAYIQKFKTLVYSFSSTLNQSLYCTLVHLVLLSSVDFLLTLLVSTVYAISLKR